jgi:O-antigen/teichoic acid export membrane protein
MGPGYDESAVVLSILAVAQVLALSQYGPEIILYGINRHKSIARLMIVIAACNVVLSVALVKVWGLIGIAIGTSIPLTLGQTIFVPIFIRRYLKLRIAEYLRNAVLPALAAGLLFGFVLAVIDNFNAADNWPGLVFNIMLPCALYVPVVLFVGCSGEERRLILARLKAREGGPRKGPAVNA